MSAAVEFFGEPFDTLSWTEPVPVQLRVSALGLLRATVTAAHLSALKAQEALQWRELNSPRRWEATDGFASVPVGEVSPVKPLAHTTRTRLDTGELVRLAAGDVAGVFGQDYDQADRNPELRLAAGGELVLAEVTSIRHGGNGCGRLRARCLPGAGIVEATVQAAQVFALYTGLHLCLPDARFVRLDERETQLGPAGQGSAELVVEVEQIDLVPRPWLRVSARLGSARVSHVVVALHEKPGTPIGPAAGGRPSTWLGRMSSCGEPVLLSEFHINHVSRGDQGVGLGPEFAHYNGRRTTRVPSGGLTLVDRLVSVDGERGRLAGATYLTEYDSPADAWYYADSANHSMPNCAYIETAAQAALLGGYYLGATLSTPDDTLSLRNLSGTATVLREVDLRDTTIRQHTELVSTDVAPGSILQDFRFTQSVRGQAHYRGEMMFGYFDDRTLGRQSGLDGGRSVPTWLAAERPRSGVRTIDVAGRRADPGARLCSRRHLALLDEVTVVDGGGRHGAGYLHAQQSFDAGYWLFGWHFPYDPVMPGSFGVESVIQAMQEWLLDCAPARRLREAEFVLPVGVPFAWKYRGQLLPADGMSTLEVHVKRIETRPGRLRMTADASVWKPGLRIYELSDVAVELREKGARPW